MIAAEKNNIFTGIASCNSNGDRIGPASAFAEFYHFCARHHLHHKISYLNFQLVIDGADEVDPNFFLIKVPSGAKKTYELMLKEGVIIRAMDSYGLEDYIRVNVGLPEENERFVQTLKKVLNR